jgi:lactate dehydrogenase-like 2-hydroxyacid dehydrogenase
MPVELDRMTIEDVGANPERLAQAIHDQLHGLEGAVPVYDIARALDIEEIREEALTSLERALITPPEKGTGAILVNARSPRQKRRYTVGDLLRRRGVRLASAQASTNARCRSTPWPSSWRWRGGCPRRDNQAKHAWRGMISDLDRREDELTGKTLLIIGLGRIGGRLAGLAKAFDMEVIGVRRDPAAGANRADSVHRFDRLPELLPRADFVALTCPLTPETQNIINAAGLAHMKPSAVLVNAARGRCVDEAALVEALRQGQISGAALDVTAEEPLAPGSPLWEMPNVFITPHTAGETRRYEANVVDILIENLERLWRGEAALRNQIV